MKRPSHDVPRVQDERDLHINSSVANWSSGWKDFIQLGYVEKSVEIDGQVYPYLSDGEAFNICLQITFEVKHIVNQHAALRRGGYRTH